MCLWSSEVRPGRLPVTGASSTPHRSPSPTPCRGTRRSGLLRGSSTLLSGATGTGKTLVATQFAAEGAALGEPALIVAYDEAPEEVRANGRTLGHDVPAYEQQGLLHIASLYPVVASLDDHLVEIRDLVERLRPTRLTIDSLSALERLGSPQGYRDFVISITSFIRTVGLASVMTVASSQPVTSSTTARSSAASWCWRCAAAATTTRSANCWSATATSSSAQPFAGIGGVLTGQPAVRS